MKRRNVRLFLTGLAIILGGQACSMSPQVTPTLPPTVVPVSSPTSVPPTPLPPSPIPPSATSAPVAAPTDTSVSDLATILKNNGFERDKSLDSACHTACSAYKNATVNVIADDYYTNKSFSLLYYGKDKNGANEQAAAAVISQLLAQLYPGSLSSDVMAVAGDFPNRLGSSRGIAGNYIWSVSISITYNLDTTIKQATIYIGVTPG
jgi:hypothetical protein